jgi:dipeptidase
MFSVREIDLNDSSNFLGTSNMWEIAERLNLYMAGDPKDFTATFSDGEYSHKYYSGRRMWGVFRLLSPSAALPSEYGNLKTDAPYPFSVPVDKLVSLDDMAAVLRDWYNGTVYSTGSVADGSDIAGGSFGTPDRFGNNMEDYSVSGNW